MNKLQPTKTHQSRPQTPGTLHSGDKIANTDIACSLREVSTIVNAEGESPEEGDSPVLKNWIKFCKVSMKIPRTKVLPCAFFLAFAVLLLDATAANASTTNNVNVTPTGNGVNIYFAPTSAGKKDGTSCANAYAYNDPIHGWSQSAQQVAGNVLHVCPGTYSGSAGSNAFSTVNSGASGTPISLVCDQGTATFSAPYWSGSSGAWGVTKNYWSLVGNGNCTIANTQNGTGLTYAIKSFGVAINGASHVTVEGLKVADICQHTSATDTTGCATNGVSNEAIDVAGNVSNITITRNTLHDAYIGIGVWASGGPMTLSDNTISRMNWGIGGFNASGPISGVNITGNDITCIAGSATCNWDTTNDQFHHNGIFIFPQSSTVSNVVIANNYIHDVNGYNNGHNDATAHIFLSAGGAGVTVSPKIYNNVLVTTAGQGPANAFIKAGIDIANNGSVTGALIVNNTMSGKATWGFGSDESATMENNIVTGPSQAEYYDSGASGNTVDYNLGYNLSNGWAKFSSLSAWQSSSTSICPGGCDKNSINSNPNLNSDFTLPSSSPAKGAGVNLTSLGIAGLDKGAPQSFGVNYACGSGCVARPATGAWDLGAYPAGSSGTASTSPSAPVGLTGVVQSN